MFSYNFNFDIIDLNSTVNYSKLIDSYNFEDYESLRSLLIELISNLHKRLFILNDYEIVDRLKELEYINTNKYFENKAEVFAFIEESKLKILNGAIENIEFDLFLQFEKNLISMYRNRMFFFLDQSLYLTKPNVSLVQKYIQKYLDNNSRNDILNIRDSMSRSLLVEKIDVKLILDIQNTNEFSSFDFKNFEYFKAFCEFVSNNSKFSLILNSNV
jgi:hypothetical protein